MRGRGTAWALVPPTAWHVLVLPGSADRHARRARGGAVPSSRGEHRQRRTRPVGRGAGPRDRAGLERGRTPGPSSSARPAGAARQPGGVGGRRWLVPVGGWHRPGRPRVGGGARGHGPGPVRDVRHVRSIDPQSARARGQHPPHRHRPLPLALTRIGGGHRHRRPALSDRCRPRGRGPRRRGAGRGHARGRPGRCPAVTHVSSVRHRCAETARAVRFRPPPQGIKYQYVKVSGFWHAPCFGRSRNLSTKGSHGAQIKEDES